MPKKSRQKTSYIKGKKKVVKKATPGKEIVKKKTAPKKEIVKKVETKRIVKKKRKEFFWKIFGARKRKNVETKDPLKIGATRRLNSLSKAKIDSETFTKLNKILRIVLKQKYKIKETLTVNEIEKHFKQTRIRSNIKTKILFLLIKLQDVEYGKSELQNRDALNKLIAQFKEVLKTI